MARSLGLTRDGIAAATLDLARRNGMQNLSMREIAAEVRATPEALFHHFPTKHLLFRYAAESLQSRFHYPPASAGPWDERLRLHALDWFATFERYPGVLHFVLSDPVVQPEARRLIEEGVGVLVEGGFDEDTARLAFGIFHRYAIGAGLALAANRARPSVKARSGREHDRTGPSVRWLLDPTLIEEGLAGQLHLMALIRDGSWP